MPTRCFLLLLIGILLAGLCGQWNATVAAQTAFQPRDAEQSPPTRLQRPMERSSPSAPSQSQGVGSVPDWAEPTSPSSDNASAIGPDATTKVPDFPENPSKVPLGFPPAALALAGIGYAVVRLRRTN